MRRVHSIELEDQRWFPASLRDAGMAYLRLAADLTGQAANIRPFLASVLSRCGESEILDLCSGGGGPIVPIARALHGAGQPVRVTMTDLYPSETAQELVAVASDELFRYEAAPIDATAVSGDRPGLRTLFNAFHHFPPDAAVSILRNAVEVRRPIAVVEVLQRRIPALLAMAATPLIVLVLFPLMRPFRVSWLLLTYVLPVIPFFVMWDGAVSVLRIYDRQELLALARRADPDSSFEWTVESIPMKPAPIPGIALVGIPKERRAG